MQELTRQAVHVGTVLVVDDEPMVHDVVARYLERDGYKTIEAGDGEQAKRIIETAAPSLVVLDLMLPGPNGLELCEWIRSTSETPVILLAALGEEEDRIAGLQPGADGYVTKPFSLRELAIRVGNILRRASTIETQIYRCALIEMDLTKIVGKLGRWLIQAGWFGVASEVVCRPFGSFVGEYRV